MRADNRLFFAAMLLLICGSSLCAQVSPELRRDCDGQTIARLSLDDLIRLGPEWVERYPLTVVGSFRKEMEEGDWHTIVTALAEDFRESEIVPQGRERRIFQANLDSLVAEFDRVAASPDYEIRMRNAEGVKLGRFDIIPDDEEPRYHLFNASAARLTFDAATPPGIRRDLCWRAFTLERLLNAYGATARQRALNELNRLVGLWNNFNNNSYSQYPWELFINGLSKPGPGDLMPPRRQWVILHPNIGVEVTGPVREWRRLDVVTLEPVGLLFYNDARTNYWGASLVGTLPTDGGPGAGLLLHLNRSARLGYVYHAESDARGDLHGIVASIDLYGLLAGVPQALETARQRAADARTAMDSTFNSPGR